MTNEQERETVADIVAEMRRVSDGWLAKLTCLGVRPTRAVIRDWADRLEAAHEREIIRAREGVKCDWSSKKCGSGCLVWEDNVKLCARVHELREALAYCVRFIGDAAEPLGADCEAVRRIGKARALLEKGNEQ